MTLLIDIDVSQQVELVKEFINSKEHLLTFSDFLQKDFKKYTGKGIVYFIFVTDKKSKITDLKYIGKSRGHLFKQRIVNHFDHKHHMTDSKIEMIKGELVKENEVHFSYITTKPEGLRSLIEEELIRYYSNQLWNIQKGATKFSKSSH